MHANVSELKLSIMITGSDEEAAKCGIELERKLIDSYGSEWNIHYR